MPSTGKPAGWPEHVQLFMERLVIHEMKISGQVSDLVVSQKGLDQKVRSLQASMLNVLGTVGLEEQMAALQQSIELEGAVHNAAEHANVSNEANIQAQASARRDDPEDSIVQLQARVSLIEARVGGMTDQQLKDSKNDLVPVPPKAEDIEKSANDPSSLGTELDDSATERPLTDLHQLRGQYEFSPSIWDASLFIGTKPIGIGGSMMLMFLLLLNIFMQSMYTIIVMFEFTNPAFDKETVEGYQQFRIRIAHDIKYIDPITRASLAAKICAGDPALEVAGQQLAALEQINGYLPKRGSDDTTLFGDQIGKLMCWLACMTWTMVVAKEVRSCIKLAVALLKHAKDHGVSQVTRTQWTGETFYIEQMGAARLTVMVMVLILRFAAAMFLLVFGLQFLVHTISLSELVLNAVALECVLSLDELIFEAFAPSQIETFVSSLAALPCPHWCFSRGLDMHAVFGLLGSACLLFATLPRWIDKEVKSLSDARDALCGGDRNFAFGSTEFAPFYVWSRTSESEGSVRDEYAEGITSSIIDVKPSFFAQNIEQPAVTGTSWSATDVQRWDRRTATIKWNALCRDLFDDMNKYLGYTEALLFLNSSGASSCQDMYGFCDEDSRRGAAARGVCPVTCGCDRPDSKLLFSSFAVGCPVTCKLTGAYQNALVTANPSCTDRSLQDLKEDLNWKYIARHSVQLAIDARWPAFLYGFLENRRDTMLEHGCAAVSILRNTPGLAGMDVCDENDDRGYPYKSLRLFCPSSCNCTSSAPNCPKSCPG